MSVGPSRTNMVIGAVSIGCLALYSWRLTTVKEFLPEEGNGCDAASPILTVTGAQVLLSPLIGPSVTMTAERFALEQRGVYSVSGLVIGTTGPLSEVYPVLRLLASPPQDPPEQPTFSRFGGNQRLSRQSGSFGSEWAYTSRVAEVRGLSVATSDLSLSAERLTIDRGRIGIFDTALFTQIHAGNVKITDLTATGEGIQSAEAQMTWPGAEVELTDGAIFRTGMPQKSYERCLWSIQERKPTDVVWQRDELRPSNVPQGLLGLRSRFFIHSN